MFKKIIFSLLFCCLFSFLAAFGLSANAQIDNTLNGLNTTAGKIDAFKGQIAQDEAIASNFIQTKAGQIIGTILSFVGVIFLILMIYAGITWMVSGGNEQQVTKAKGMMVNSIIGIIIVFAAYAIISFVGTELLK
jgi:hypothetical protein